jgi:glycosyltransferase involved in cell wall biosynthesis
MDMTECIEEIRRLGLEEAVIKRFEYIADEHVAAYFSMADLVAIPYVAITQSGILFEAMTFGCPVVTSDVGAVGPTVLENDIGLVVPPGDEDELARAIERVVSEPDLSRTFSENGRRAAADRYSWQQCAKTTDQVYRSLIDT